MTQLILKKISNERDEMESRSGRNEIERTSSPEDTMELMSAISYGYNLSRQMPTMPLHSPSSGQGPVNNMTARGGPPSGPTPPAKAISSIKTNIKAATQVHPYQRN